MTTRSPTLTSARFDTKSIRSGSSPSESCPATTPPAPERCDHRAGPGLAVDQQLDLRRVRVAFRRRVRRCHPATITAMSVRRPSCGAAIDRDRAEEPDRRVAGDDVGGERAQLARGPSARAASRAARRASASACCSCSRTRDRHQLVLAAAGSRARTPRKREVAVPDAAHAAEAAATCRAAPARTTRTSPPGAPASPTASSPARRSGSPARAGRPAADIRCGGGSRARPCHGNGGVLEGFGLGPVSQVRSWSLVGGYGLRATGYDYGASDTFELRPRSTPALCA